MSEYSEWSKTLRNMIFNWRPDEHVCVCAQLSNFQWWQFSCKLMPNLKFYGILNFLKNVCGSSNFHKIWAIVLKMHTNIIHRSRTFGIEFDQNRLERSNFLRFWLFWKFSLNRVTCSNFELLSSKFIYECTNTKWYFRRNLVRIGRGL